MDPKLEHQVQHPAGLTLQPRPVRGSPLRRRPSPGPRGTRQRRPDSFGRKRKPALGGAEAAGGPRPGAVQSVSICTSRRRSQRSGCAHRDPHLLPRHQGAPDARPDPDPRHTPHPAGGFAFRLYRCARSRLDQGYVDRSCRLPAGGGEVVGSRFSGRGVCSYRAANARCGTADDRRDGRGIRHSKKQIRRGGTLAYRPGLPTSHGLKVILSYGSVRLCLYEPLDQGVGIPVRHTGE